MKKATLAIGLSAVVVAGCGGGGAAAKQQVRSSFEHIISELKNRNPAACQQFTSRYAQENTGNSSYSAALAICRRHVQSGSVSVPTGIKVEKLKVKGDKATVVALAAGQGTGVFKLVKQGNQWKIDSVTAK